ncbi:hypothetical protein DEA8626_04160 [Defluviimonas aquaemixtae]|uniref:Uncharacterized protein n=1 Tax=Albidovulum aquaemixtae TaxID=1542388 RepID=A0A2R8BNV4_9RHOB|nr:hypothetical protein [Defluviimonas aquaemixtae]SPH25124.1 hypothetical protein DEA8626_04160 [Defluviimonas aquaemixtae]
MTRTERKYHTAAILLFLSAALHLPILILSFQKFGTHIFVAIILWTLLGLGLLRGHRLAAYLAFLGMLAGLVLALDGATSSPGLVAIVLWVIIPTNLIAAAVLFGVLWSRPSAHSET